MRDYAKEIMECVKDFNKETQEKIVFQAMAACSDAAFLKREFQLTSIESDTFLRCVQHYVKKERS